MKYILFKYYAFTQPTRNKLPRKCAKSEVSNNIGSGVMFGCHILRRFDPFAVDMFLRICSSLRPLHLLTDTQPLTVFCHFEHKKARNGPTSGNLGPYPPNFFSDPESYDIQLTYIRMRKNYVENFQLGQTY